MKKELDDLRKERDTLKKGQQAAEGRAKAIEAALARNNAARHDSSDEELKQTKDRMQELVTKFRETIQTLREVESESVTAKQAYATSDRELKTCVEHNAALYKLNGEVLDRLEHQSGWSRVASIEPFTKIKRVQLENLVDDYKSRADDQKLRTAAPPAAPPAPNPATPTAGPELKDRQP
jgi:chromosome segregation ATPase